MPNAKLIKKGGYVYIMMNPAMPGLLKIGSTTLTPDHRAQQLSATTAVPRPYKVVAYHWFENEREAERKLQAMFKQNRVPRREHYEITLEQGREALSLLINGTLQPMDDLDHVQSTEVSDTNSTSDTNASVLGLHYWGRFNEMRAEQKLLPRFENAGPRPRSFLRYFLQRKGKGNIHYEGRIRIKRPQVSMHLEFKTAHYKEVFELIAQDRDKIEKEIGLRLLWNSWPTEDHIATERDDMDSRDVADWKRQHTWLSEVVSAFDRVIRPRVEKLFAPA